MFDPEAAFTAAIEATERTVAALRERAAAGDCSADDTEGRQKISETITYLRNKENHLHYDTALVKGRPIATRTIEGACRHLVADRLDITGARWSLAGAEAVLKLRAPITNGDLDTYWRYHLKQERSHNHQTRYQLAA